MQPVRFKSRDGFLVAGPRQAMAVEQAPQVIPGMFKQLFSLLPLKDQVGQTTYGVTCGSDGVTMDYLAGVEVAGFDPHKPVTELGRVKVPAAEYAVFEHQGLDSGIKATWTAVMGWLRNNPEWADGHSPCFEVYDQRYCSGNAESVFEIWVPVVKLAK